MAFAANSAPYILRRVASAICLIAILLLTTPCSMAQQPPTPAMHCSDCCDHNLALTIPQFCCASHPQPTQPSAVTSAVASIRTVEALPAPSPVLSPQYRKALISASPSPPPLHPILRI